ncbi:cytochrome-c peroxidase [Pontibacter qinzhouensis]|uniref:Cytochrome-c peroxidase n=1 Tax=Pontibacter qinzhouensis TaxID=2603253 RepID=A0A5C8K8J5_9BACT|nr:cytochrome c peroxidase [Pontibacter qinzhouensis]TXK46937.1 cytochrome-c peroxidase [Pontibacter qinzhouensis]
MNKKLHSIYLSVLLAALFSCSPEAKEEPEPTTPTHPTPFELVRPSIFPRIENMPPDNPLTVEGIELGRHLFYEKRLSGNNTMSCGSCHMQEKAFTDGKALAIGELGLAHTRNTMSIANLAWFNRFNWDGSAFVLEEQARGPIENHIEMNQNLAEAVHELQATTRYPGMFEKAFGSATITEQNILKALAQFQRTLVSANSRYDQHMMGTKKLSVFEEEGMELFMTHPEPSISLRGGNCGDCHGGTLISLKTFHNNGLDVTFADKGLGAVTGNPRHEGIFKAPSLRNIALTAPYMHDGRFKTLEEVLDHYNDHMRYDSPGIDPLITEASNEVNGKTLLITEEEKRKIIAFLHALTDSSFITNPNFSDPFK